MATGGGVFCRAPGALDTEAGVTFLVPFDLLSHFSSTSITPRLALVSRSRSRSAGNRYVKAWSRRHYTNKCCRTYRVDPRSLDARSEFRWSWITGQGTVPTQRFSTMMMSVVWWTEVLHWLCRGSPGKRVRRPEQEECTVQSVDDSAGRSNMALGAYDFGCHLGREYSIQTSFRVRNIASLINHLAVIQILS